MTTADEEDDDDLQTRPGQFLPVENDGANNKETSLKGGISLYEPIGSHLVIKIENLGFHKPWDASDARIRHAITDKTADKFRAIETESNYQILDVTIDATLVAGTAVIVNIYMNNGHSLGARLQLGLTESAIVALIDMEHLSGQIVISNIQGNFYGGNDIITILLPYWKEHVITPIVELEICAAWEFKFNSLTLSPKGYSPIIGMLSDAEIETVRIAGPVSVTLRDDDAFKSAVETVTSKLTAITRQGHYTMITLTVIAIILLWFSMKVQMWVADLSCLQTELKYPYKIKGSDAL